ncbi:MAG: ferrous iron transport protein B [candidate division FCPU426 bacterium]
MNPFEPARGRGHELVIALAGQPNCGKSTIFNTVGGFKVNTANFAGTSVSYAETTVCFHGRTFRLIDLPGTYSISSFDLAEKVTRDFLLSGQVDVIISVADASLLSRSLEFTLQLQEMGVPMVLALNMIDEAHRKGMQFDVERFRELTGVAALEVTAVQGKGIPELFAEAIRLAEADYRPILPQYDRDVEQCLAGILGRYPAALATPNLSPRFVAIRLLEMDEHFGRLAREADPAFADFVDDQRRQLAELHGWPEAGVLASHRHAVVLDLYEQIATHRRGSSEGLRERVDAFITSPLGGLATLAVSLLAMFYSAFWLGDVISGWLEGPFARLSGAILALGAGPFESILMGLAQGVEAGAGIILPYLIPLLVLLALYEDTGFLPRLAFLLDGLLHRVGLHGKSIVPLIIGYGCNVPAIMATRNLDNWRDRMIAMLAIPFITCSARTVVILALAGKYLGAGWTAFMYLLGLAGAMLLAFALSRTKAGSLLGVIMDMPPLRRPYPGIIVKKIWLRLREFLVVAWPVIAIASVVLSVLSFYGFDRYVNAALAPLTSGVMHLPASTGIALFLGVFRKELALAILGTALGGDIGAVLSHQQILVLVVFTTLYIPCLATLAALWKEGGWKTCLASAALNLLAALAVAGLFARLALI